VIGVVVVVLALYLAIAFIGRAIGESRGRPELGFFISLLAGPLGWVLVLFLPKSAEVEAIEARRNTATDAATGTAPDGPRANSDAYQRNLSVLDLLERLHGLMQSGALTADEYEIQKRRLLAEQPASTPTRHPVEARPSSRGWHPDPQHSGKERYYNGRKWTFQTRYKTRTQ
jgi:hypothetical protein